MRYSHSVKAVNVKYKHCTEILKSHVKQEREGETQIQNQELASDREEIYITPAVLYLAFRIEIDIGFLNDSRNELNKKSLKKRV